MFNDEEYNRQVLKVLVLVVIFLEFFIFCVALSKSNASLHTYVYDDHGKVIYEMKGSVITERDVIALERMYGPLARYHIRETSEHTPFPFRGWLAAAIGIPVGILLLLSLVVRMYFSLLYGERETPRAESMPGDSPVRLGTLLGFLQNSSVFYVAIVLVVLVLALWLIPSWLGGLAKLSLATIEQFKWFFLGVTFVLAAFIFWIVYLRYKLSGKMIDNELELQKFKVERHLIEQQQTPSPPLLSGRAADSDPFEKSEEHQPH